MNKGHFVVYDTKHENFRYVIPTEMDPFVWVNSHIEVFKESGVEAAPYLVFETEETDVED